MLANRHRERAAEALEENLPPGQQTLLNQVKKEIEGYNEDLRRLNLYETIEFTMSAMGLKSYKDFVGALEKHGLYDDLLEIANLIEEEARKTAQIYQAELGKKPRPKPKLPEDFHQKQLTSGRTVSQVIQLLGDAGEIKDYILARPTSLNDVLEAYKGDKG